MKVILNTLLALFMGLIKVSQYLEGPFMALVAILSPMPTLHLILIFVLGIIGMINLPVIAAILLYFPTMIAFLIVMAPVIERITRPRSGNHHY